MVKDIIKYFAIAKGYRYKVILDMEKLEVDIEPLEEDNAYHYNLLDCMPYVNEYPTKADFLQAFEEWLQNNFDEVK